MDVLSFDEASDYLGISRKYLENYAKAGEIAYKRTGRGYKVERSELDRFIQLRNWRTVTLNRDDYLECFNFAVRSFYAYLQSGSTADFLGARERGIGKWAEDFVPGKLGEIACQKFLKEKYGILTKLDFSIGQGIPAQDIVEVAKPRKGPLVFNPARIRTSIKTSKMKNVWLAIPENEVKSQERASDVYIFVRVDLPLNHLARFGRESELFARLKEIIPEFESVPAEVVGFAWRGELEHRPEGIKEASISKPQYALPSGKLRCSDADWQDYISKL